MCTCKSLDFGTKTLNIISIADYQAMDDLCNKCYKYNFFHIFPNTNNAKE